MKIPDHYSVLKEHPSSFEIHDKRDNSSFHIAKQHLDSSTYAKMASVQKFADGGQAQPPPPPQPVQDAQASMRKAFHFADGTPDGGVPSVNLSASDLSDDLPKDFADKNVSKKDISKDIDKAAAEQAAANNPGEEQSLQNLANIGKSAAPAPEVEDASPQAMPASYEAPEDQSQAAAPAQSQAQAPQASPEPQEKAPIPQGAPQGPLPGSVEDYQSRIDQNLRDLNDPNGRYAKLQQAVLDNKVDPNQYWKDHSKVASALGIILGGFGQGLMHSNSNQALAVVQDGIKNEMEAQSKNSSNQMDLLKLNNNDKLATMNQLYTMAQMTLQKQAMQTNTTQAKLQAQMTIQQIQQLKQENAIKGASLKFLNDPSSQSGPQKQGLINNGRWQALKGAGLMNGGDEASATKEATSYTEAQVLKQDMESSAIHLQKQFLNGALTPGDRDSATNAFAGRIAKIGEGRFNLQEAELQAKALLPQPGDLPSTLRNKTERREQFFTSLAQTPTLDRLGLVNKPSLQPVIKTMNGMQYKKVAGGWMKVNPVSNTAAR